MKALAIAVGLFVLGVVAVLVLVAAVIPPRHPKIHEILDKARPRPPKAPPFI